MTLPTFHPTLKSLQAEWNCMVYSRSRMTDVEPLRSSSCKLVLLGTRLGTPSLLKHSDSWWVPLSPMNVGPRVRQDRVGNGHQRSAIAALLHAMEEIHLDFLKSKVGEGECLSSVFFLNLCSGLTVQPKSQKTFSWILSSLFSMEPSNYLYSTIHETHKGRGTQMPQQKTCINIP